MKKTSTALALAVLLGATSFSTPVEAGFSLKSILPGKSKTSSSKSSSKSKGGFFGGVTSKVSGMFGSNRKSSAASMPTIGAGRKPASWNSAHPSGMPGGGAGAVGPKKPSIASRAGNFLTTNDVFGKLTNLAGTAVQAYGAMHSPMGMGMPQQPYLGGMQQPMMGMGGYGGQYSQW